ncbi:ParA family protein [Clostridium lundense]|uniref:ParA family protein n=1 Tax=Clostridium lundense TaxID=319475 RepID=UPI000488597E|nr:ParA family protein [Clostridium lundense]
MKDSPNVISFLNMKGGVCKTTLCKEMALFLSEVKDRDILVIDIDPQSNCTQSFFERYNVLQIDEGELITCETNLPSIENVFSKSKGGLREIKLEDVIYELSNKLHIVPGDLNTVFMERETGTGASEQKLFNFIDQFKLQEKYDYIFIDCPPTYSFYTVSALLSSNYYLVPLKSDAYSLLGLDLLERVVTELRSLYRANFSNRPINNLGTIFTMIPKTPSKGVLRNIEQIKEAFKDKNVYFFRNDFPRADKISTGKLSTFIMDRDDAGLYEKLAEICQEFEERMANLNG